MIGFPTGAHVWIVAGVTDLRRGFTGLSALVETALQQDPFAGHLFVFHGRRFSPVSTVACAQAITRFAAMPLCLSNFSVLLLYVFGFHNNYVVLCWCYIQCACFLS
jgi:hypothetical protein